jgi:ubiquinone/menaquinone biosynthesis C-methylase UbiE
MANKEQVEMWSGEVGEKWVTMQDVLDRQLEHIAKELLQAAGIEPGMAVLDIGCGCGAISLLAGEEVGQDGRVLGVDISAPMLARARERADEAGMPWVAFDEADAQSYAFEAGAFDLMVSRFGVMFFEDPVAAFANIRTALKPGGRMVFLCWQPATENPWVTIPMAAVKDLVEMPPPAEPNAPGPFGLADKERTQTTLEQAGFADVDIQPLNSTMNIAAGSSIEAAVEFLFKMGPVSRVLTDIDDATRDKARDVLAKALGSYHTPEGVVMDAHMWLVTAKNS